MTGIEDTRAGRVLVVCTGNVCRSPFVEHVLSARLSGPKGQLVEVESAGTRALVGSPVDQHIAETLAAHSVDASTFRARQLHASHIAWADLVITATRDHRREVVTLLPRSVGKVFTLRQLARLIEQEERRGNARDGRSLQAMVDAYSNLRGMRTPSAGADDDVPDPYRRSEAEYDRAVRIMTPAVETIVWAFTPSGGGRDASHSPTA